MVAVSYNGIKQFLISGKADICEGWWVGWNEATTMAPSDKRFQSLAVGCTSEPPPGAGGIGQLGDNNGSVYGL